MYAATQPTIDPSWNPALFNRRDELISAHIHLVKVIAIRIQRTLGVHVEVEDLIHAGTLGLFEAATKYQDEKQVPFPVYAKHRIRGAILDSLRQLDWATRDARRQYKQIETVTRELTAKLGCAPSSAQVAEAMGIDEKRWQALMVDFQTCGVAALSQRAAESEDSLLREIPAPPCNRPDREVERSEMKQLLTRAMGVLPERYRQVVELYYRAEMSMKEIGSVMGVNESRVCQIHKGALAKMQAELGKQGLGCSAFLC